MKTRHRNSTKDLKRVGRGKKKREILEVRRREGPAEGGSGRGVPAEEGFQQRRGSGRGEEGVQRRGGSGGGGVPAEGSDGGGGGVRQGVRSRSRGSGGWGVWRMGGLGENGKERKTNKGKHETGIGNNRSNKGQQVRNERNMKEDGKEYERGKCFSVFFCPEFRFLFCPYVVFFVPRFFLSRLSFFILSRRPVAYFVPFPFFCPVAFFCPVTVYSGLARRSSLLC